MARKLRPDNIHRALREHSQPVTANKITFSHLPQSFEGTGGKLHTLSSLTENPRKEEDFHWSKNVKCAFGNILEIFFSDKVHTKDLILKLLSHGQLLQPHGL